MTANTRKLQVKLLSGSGELLNCINCFAGQVSVFRASSNSALLPYLRALSGNSGPERFIVELNGEPFISSDHNIIGFGERFIAGDGGVKNFLISAGVPESTVESVLLAFGLESYLNSPCCQLSRCQERRLRILAAVYSQDKILIVNDPFDPISSEWRERFAELLVQFCRSKGQIVVVPALTYRPECWIDNEFISRIQVGENILKTVGFSNQPTDVQALVFEMREQMKREAAVEKASEIVPAAVSTPLIEEFGIEEEHSPADPFFNRYYSSLRPFLSDRRIVGALAVLVLSIPFLLPKTSEEKVVNHSVSVPRLVKEKPPIQVAKVQNVEKQPANNNPVQVEVKIPPPPPVKVANETVLDRYPVEIKQAVLHAINGGPSNSALLPASIQTEPEKNKENQVGNNQAGDLLKLLQYAGNDEADKSSGEDPPPYINARIPNDLPVESGNEQERREQIRQKFLEAIQRAQERKADELPR